MVRHHDKGMRFPEATAIKNRADHGLSDRRLAQKDRTRAGQIKQSIQSDELFAAFQVRRKESVCRQTTRQTPGHKRRVADLMEVRKPFTVLGHRKIVPIDEHQSRMKAAELKLRPS